MLAVEYGIITIEGGAEAKVAMSVVRDLLKKALEQGVEAAAGNSNSQVMRALDIVGDVVTVGGVAIGTVVVSGICLAVSFVSLIVACCMKSDKDRQTVDNRYGRSVGPAGPGETPMLGEYESKSPKWGITEVSSPWQTPVMPASPYQGNSIGYTSRHLGV
jgi:hypothetical protein